MSNFLKYKNTRLKALYNVERLKADKLKEILADDLAGLFTHATEICETHNALSYKVDFDGETLFLKSYKPATKLRRSIREHFSPSCFDSFQAAFELEEKEIPTPTALLAVHIPEIKKQILVTDFCQDTTSMDMAMGNDSAFDTVQIGALLAEHLVRFHMAGFYSRHLRSANIIISKAADKLWFIDLDKMGHNWYLPKTSTFTSTVSRAGFEFFFLLSDAAADAWLKQCFTSALEAGLFTKDSEAAFLDAVKKDLYKRRFHTKESLTNPANIRQDD
ncbi:MAG: hypothetical protein HRT89_14930 [Lentisphaeria bacterium]|nr:hypothetical protein [Lentisphaeria bacterium]NQZ69354.1 hypothetical protein [Lentisphaeria bacterium]